jgi:hypothetical protein
MSSPADIWPISCIKQAIMATTNRESQPKEETGIICVVAPQLGCAPSCEMLLRSLKSFGWLKQQRAHKK